MNIRWINFLFLIFTLFLTGCKNHDQKTLKIAASSMPHAEILEFIKPALEKDQIDLEIIIVDDYNMPNRALADKEVDANFFQHFPFLEAQMKNFGYDLVPLVGVHLEPLGLYSKKISSINELKKGSTIGIPSDPSNQSRALALLQQEDLIQLIDKGTKTSVIDIENNPLNLKFIELDSALLSRALDDVDAAIINTNFALLTNLSPQKDAIALENGQSRFVNIVVVRNGDEQREDMIALKKALTSNETREYILEHYHGALSPAF
ncbi:MAG: MetQ/NlpA family ABC transporter substrate-binding protein [Parachlamydiaceae bacterium]|nr:MetQ/NlpA family ABC transporter substrate-binding protein [Parachlamydiaceae bacterium]